MTENLMECKMSEIIIPSIIIYPGNTHLDPKDKKVLNYDGSRDIEGKFVVEDIGGISRIIAAEGFKKHLSIDCDVGDILKNMGFSYDEILSLREPTPERPLMDPKTSRNVYGGGSFKFSSETFRFYSYSTDLGEFNPLQVEEIAQRYLQERNLSRNIETQ